MKRDHTTRVLVLLVAAWLAAGDNQFSATPRRLLPDQPFPGATSA